MTDKERLRTIRDLIDHHVYPMIAGRTIILTDAGEEKAAKAWGDLCNKVLDVMEKTK